MVCNLFHLSAYFLNVFLLSPVISTVFLKGTNIVYLILTLQMWELSFNLPNILIVFGII
nr:MAG TPA: hypothetical protein [Herelleviridae sp.]